MTSLPQRPYSASNSSPATSAGNAGTHSFAPVTRSGPPRSDGAEREQAVNLLPHRIVPRSAWGQAYDRLAVKGELPELTRGLSEADVEAINARLKETRHISINAPSFVDYFDEYARMAVGIVGFGTLALGLFAWVTM